MAGAGSWPGCSLRTSPPPRRRAGHGVPGDRGDTRTLAGRLSYGLEKRVELGRALASEPKLLLLDEPMAGMNSEEKCQLSDFIVAVNWNRGTTILLIEHDMGVVMDLSDRIVVLDYGRKIAEGPPAEIPAKERVIDAYLGRAA